VGVVVPVFASRSLIQTIGSLRHKPVNPVVKLLLIVLADDSRRLGR
jgi:hypothetical protein